MGARRLLLFILTVLLALPAAAHAEVTVTFYSHEFGENFPHAFVKLDGTIEATGEPVDISYGFTARSVSPAILFGSVKGKIQVSRPNYVAKSDPQFSLAISDAQYGELLALVGKWQALPGRSYNLGRRNCVHFVAEVARLLGLSTNPESRYFKKPRSFLREVLALNPRLSPAFAD